MSWTSYKDYYRQQYNMTKRQFDELLARSGGVCAICHQNKKLVVDHCHQTGKVRGLICGACNSGLGFFRDNLLALENAIEYLRRPSGVPFGPSS